MHCIVPRCTYVDMVDSDLFFVQRVDAFMAESRDFLLSTIAPLLERCDQYVLLVDACTTWSRCTLSSEIVALTLEDSIAGRWGWRRSIAVSPTTAAVVVVMPTAMDVSNVRAASLVFVV